MKNGFIRKKYYEKASSIILINGRNVILFWQTCFALFLFLFRCGSDVNENVDFCLRCDFSNVVATLHTTKQLELRLSSVVFFLEKMKV